MVGSVITLVINLVCAVTVHTVVRKLIKEKDIQAKNHWAKAVLWLVWGMVVVGGINLITHLV